MTRSSAIDLNADLGERPDATDVDAELMRYITSANIACGGHAGDERSIRQTIETALSLGVAIGAHPSYPDITNFGRVAMNIGPSELEHSLRDQLNLIISIARDLGARVGHVKPHGALYHSANSDPAVARAIADAVAAVDYSLIVVAQYASPALEVFQRAGLRTATEAFADRAYEPDGRLRSRSLPGALLTAPQAVEQALNIVMNGYAIASDGSQLTITPDTLCIHSDTPSAPEIARSIRERLEHEGIRPTPLG
jgi:5-oxoprolinase (ATP-hydrolysing) subunit A